jgi:hypothetical protein
MAGLKTKKNWPFFFFFRATTLFHHDKGITGLTELGPDISGYSLRLK